MTALSKLRLAFPSTQTIKTFLSPRPEYLPSHRIHHHQPLIKLVFKDLRNVALPVAAATFKQRPVVFRPFIQWDCIAFHCIGSVRIHSNSASQTGRSAFGVPNHFPVLTSLPVPPDDLP
jgi:hypothetical protein